MILDSGQHLDAREEGQIGYSPIYVILTYRISLIEG